jgi:adenine-specific DNA glycosylase
VAPVDLAVHGEVRHAFTHFRLQARVWRAESPAVAATTATGATRATAATAPRLPVLEWLDLADAPGAALPRPVKALLLALAPR